MIYPRNNLQLRNPDTSSSCITAQLFQLGKTSDISYSPTCIVLRLNCRSCSSKENSLFVKHRYQGYLLSFYISHVLKYLGLLLFYKFYKIINLIPQTPDIQNLILHSHSIWQNNILTDKIWKSKKWNQVDFFLINGVSWSSLGNTVGQRTTIYHSSSPTHKPEKYHAIKFTFVWLWSWIQQRAR